MLRILATIVFACTCVGTLADVSPAQERPGVEQLRKAVDAGGRVTDEQLRKDTGWEVMRGFTWGIEIQNPLKPDQFVAVEATRAFHSGQRFRVRVEAFCDIFAYVVVRNADGSAAVLLPEQGEPAPKIAQGKSVVLPPDESSFRFSPPGGIHQLRLIASPVPLPFSDAPRLLRLRNGQELTTRDVAAMKELKHIKGLKSVVDQIGRGKLAKGCQVVLLEPGADGNLVTLTSANPDAKPILAHDVLLKQVD